MLILNNPPVFLLRKNPAPFTQEGLFTVLTGTTPKTWSFFIISIAYVRDAEREYSYSYFILFNPPQTFSKAGFVTQLDTQEGYTHRKNNRASVCDRNQCENRVW